MPREAYGSSIPAGSLDGWLRWNPDPSVASAGLPSFLHAELLLQRRSMCSTRSISRPFPGSSTTPFKMTNQDSGVERLPRTIAELIETARVRWPSAQALLDQSGAVLSYEELASAVTGVGRRLREAGIGPADRVAIVCRPGQHCAVAVLSCLAHAVAAPLNPASTEETFLADLASLRARAVLTDGDPPEALRAALHHLGIPTVNLPCEPISRWLPNEFCGSGSVMEPSHLALVLKTSGTTAVPKVVPLTPTHLLVSAYKVADVLHLQPTDRSLTMMPLFHVHGIVTGLLAPLSSGGSVICARGTDLVRILDLLHSLQPTWISAVPTVHQGLLKIWSEKKGSFDTCHQLRFIRSSSAPLPATVREQLEEAFQVPVIEAYGMTETAQMISSNRLPPEPRFPGSVGRMAGPEEVVVMGPGLEILPPGERGEVAVRGRNVIDGYEGMVSGWVTAASGKRWFLTGDEGYLNADGHLFITGRLKEMINRGGEKVIPRQVDEALLQHPAVEEAVAFSVPHPTLGQDLAAAVVLAPGAGTSENELRGHCLASLAPFQVPSQIIVLDELPKGSTGKLQRIGLAERLKGLLAPPEDPLEGEVEQLVGEIFAAVLGVAVPSRDSNFFALGGDSLTGQQVISRLNSQLPLDLPATLLFRHPTPRMLAADLEGRIDSALASLKAGA